MSSIIHFRNGVIASSFVGGNRIIPSPSKPYLHLGDADDAPTPLRRSRSVQPSIASAARTRVRRSRRIRSLPTSSVDRAALLRSRVGSPLTERDRAHDFWPPAASMRRIGWPHSPALACRPSAGAAVVDTTRRCFQTCSVSLGLTRNIAVAMTGLALLVVGAFSAIAPNDPTVVEALTRHGAGREGRRRHAPTKRFSAQCPASSDLGSVPAKAPGRQSRSRAIRSPPRAIGCRYPCAF
jgi:hypothetical protein